MTNDISAFERLTNPIGQARWSLGQIDRKRRKRSHQQLGSKLFCEFLVEMKIML